MSLNKIPPEIDAVLSRLEAAGWEAYLVGGCVRDSLLGLEPQDWDITTAAPPQRTMEIFGDDAIPTGLRYGTVTVKSGSMTVEVTTFRTDGAYSDNRRPDSIGFANSLIEDLARRDFTVNAIACSLEGEIFDPYNGIADLRNRIIRCVGVPRERFEEDALRMFRALRIAAKLNFTIHPNTFSAIYEKAHLAAFLSAERIKDEIQKFLKCDNTYLLSCIFESGLMNSFGTGSFSPDLEMLSGLPAEGFSRLAGLCRVVEKEAGIIPRRFLDDLRMDHRSSAHAAGVCRILADAPPCERKSWKRLLSEYGEDICISAAAVAAVLEESDCRELVDDILRSGECWDIHSLALGGNELKALGYAGRDLGDELRELLEAVIESPELNTEEALTQLALDKLCSI